MSDFHDSTRNKLMEKSDLYSNISLSVEMSNFTPVKAVEVNYSKIEDKNILNNKIIDDTYEEKKSGCNISEEINIIEKLLSLKNFFVELNSLEYSMSYVKLEKHLLELFNKSDIKFESSLNDDNSSSTKIQNDILESSMIISDPNEIKTSNKVEEIDEIEKLNIKVKSESNYYYEKMINNILAKYKPKTLEENIIEDHDKININMSDKSKNEKVDKINNRRRLARKEAQIDKNEYKNIKNSEINNSQDNSHDLIDSKKSDIQENKLHDYNLNFNDNFKIFSHLLKELDKKIIYVVSKKIFKRQKKLDSNTIDFLLNNVVPYCELHKLNDHNTLLKIIIYTIYKFPIEIKIYINWKVRILNLLSQWNYQRDTLEVKKYKLNYLKAKFIIEKLIRNKENGTLAKNFICNYVYIEEPKSSIMPSVLVNKISKNIQTNIPRFSFLPTSVSMVFLDLLVDIHMLYFMFISPYLYVIPTNNKTLDFLGIIFNSVYFINVIRNFRRLEYTETNVLIVNLFYILWKYLFSVTFAIDVFSLIPFFVFYNNITEGFVIELYYILNLIPILRIPNCGNTIEIIEKTKYAKYSRLIMLIFKFFILAHWIGLFFVKFVTFDYFSDDYNLGDDCKIYKSGLTLLTDNCKYIISLFDGEYIVPGGYIEGLNLFENFTSFYDYIFLFISYFIGQILVAYSFGGILDLIKNLNQAANIYREKLDNIKALMTFYSYDENTFKDVLIFYEYIWLKKRNSVYDSNIFYGLPEHLYEKIIKRIQIHFRYFLKDFYKISKNKENKLLSALLNNMKEYLAFPYEKIYTQGNVIKGLFVLIDGNVLFADGNVETEDKKNEIDDDGLGLKEFNKEESQRRFDFVGEISVNKYIITERMKFYKKNELDPYDIPLEPCCFPLDSIFLKTGRAIETCYVNEFTDFYIIDLDYFDRNIIINFPYEMNNIKEKIRVKSSMKIGRNRRITEMVFRHSSRCVGSYYEDKYTLENIWIDIKLKIPTMKKINDDEDLNDIRKYVNGLFDLSFRVIKINAK